MNDIQYLIDRQLGFAGRFGYDSVLKRLVVREAEAFYGLGASGVEDPPIFACRFAETSGYEHILALANEDGRVAIQDITKSSCPGGSLDGFPCHNNAVFDLAWRPRHMNFVTVSGDHTACLWDVAEGAPRRVQVFTKHSRSVKTAVFCPEQPSVFATGGRDGHVLVWDVRAAQTPAVVVKPDNTLFAAHAGCTPPTPRGRAGRIRSEPRPVSITGLVFQRADTLLSCGECDGNIKAWDLRRAYSAHTRCPLPAHAIPYGGASARRGYTHLLLDAPGTRLYASCVDNVIYCFNVATYCPLPERRYIGHENSSYYIKAELSADGQYLISGSSDTHAYIWDVGSARPLLRLVGHRAEVTCAAWARAPVPTVVTCSDDARHMVWKVGYEDDRSDVMLRGRAEVIPNVETGRALWGGNRTPASLKRRAVTPRSHGGKRVATHRRPTIKRCLTDLLNAHSESDENSATKRARLDEPAPAAERAHTPTSSSRPADRPAPSPPKRARLADDDTDNEALKEDYMKTPTKNLTNGERKALSPRSPNTLGGSPEARVRLFTSELPDWVRDGDAPHLRLMSPGKRKADTPTRDWLTQLARDKRVRTQSHTQTVPPADSCPSISQVPPVPLPRTPPARRGSTSDRTPKSTKTRTLLKYFTVTSKENV